MVSTSPPADAVVRFGTFELDVRSGELRRTGVRVPLQQQPLTILVRLLERPGEVVTREVLQRELWPDSSFGDFEHGLNAAVKRLRDALDDSADNPRFIETLPRRGYRFIAPVASARTPSDLPDRYRPATRTIVVFVSVLVLAATGLLVWWRVARRPQPAADGLTILVADFVNKTHDAVFDDTLKQALRTDLEQSPSFRLISSDRIRQTLKEMTRSPNDRVAGDVAYEVCQRAGANVVLSGTIAAIGSRYVVGLEAADCESKRIVAEQQASTADREHVLDVIGQIARPIRRRLGESAATLQRFNVPVREATTASLEALKAFSVAEQVREERGDIAAEPFYQRAIELDRDFGLVFARLATIYANAARMDEMRHADAEAYARRDRVTERERLYIDARHCTARQPPDMDCYITILELWKRTYPLDSTPYINLCNSYNNVRADYDRALVNGLEAVRLAPENWMTYANVVTTLMALNRFAEAKQMTDAAVARHVAVPRLREIRYVLAFATADHDAMAVEERAIRGTDEEFRFVARQSEMAAFEGRFGNARDLRARAIQLTNGRMPAWTSELESLGSATEAIAGFRPCRMAARETAPDDNGTRYRLVAALACGDYVRAQRLLEGIRPMAPVVAPARIAIAIGRGEHSAIGQMPAPAATDIGTATGFRPVYLRALAFRVAGDDRSAAAEFQRIIDHRGIAITSPLYPLAYVEQARAFVHAGDVVKARTAYESFLKLWEHADADIPVLVAAKSEYEALSDFPSRR